jgi:acyl-CoA thioester hydrolase
VKPPQIPLENIFDLAPACLRMAVPDAYGDRNDHMNMRWYLAIFDEAGDVLQARLGLTPDSLRERRAALFDLEHHLHYLSEVHPGETVAVYARLVAHSVKRVHYLLFMVNETRSRLAAICECLGAFVDLTIRKTVPFPPEIAASLAARLAHDAARDWPPPVCGAIELS